jgi:hypothetical protein
MIFPPKQVHRILSGRKTQTRRLIVNYKPSTIHAGHDYPVSSPGHRAEFRVKILEVRDDRLGRITLIEARAEGFRTTHEFQTDWVRVHDVPWVERHIGDRHNSTDPGELAEVDGILLGRFHHAHARKRVQVVTFEVIRDVSFYMAGQRAILSGREPQYTPNRARAIDDLPVVDAATTAAWAKEASEDGVRRRETLRHDLEAARREQKRARAQTLREAA